MIKVTPIKNCDKCGKKVVLKFSNDFYRGECCDMTYLVSKESYPFPMKVEVI